MNKILKILLIFTVISYVGCKDSTKKPRIAIAGLAIESSTFSPAKQLKKILKPELVQMFLPFIHFYLKIQLIEIKLNGYQQ